LRRTLVGWRGPDITLEQIGFLFTHCRATTNAAFVM